MLKLTDYHILADRANTPQSSGICLKSYPKALHLWDRHYRTTPCLSLNCDACAKAQLSDILSSGEPTGFNKMEDKRRRSSVVSNIRRWADKFRLHYNIFIYIRHIWIKPVLCSRMMSLFHHTSPWTHRCLQLSPSAYRNWRVFRRSVQTACCYWILNRGKNSSNWNSQKNASPL